MIAGQVLIAAGLSEDRLVVAAHAARRLTGLSDRGLVGGYVSVVAYLVSPGERIDEDGCKHLDHRRPVDRPALRPPVPLG